MVIQSHTAIGELLRKRAFVALRSAQQLVSVRIGIVVPLVPNDRQRGAQRRSPQHRDCEVTQRAFCTTFTADQ